MKTVSRSFIGIFENYNNEVKMSTNNGIFYLTREYIGESPENASGCTIRFYTNLIDPETKYILQAVHGFLINTGNVYNLTFDNKSEITFWDMSSPDHTENICKKIRMIVKSLEL